MRAGWGGGWERASRPPSPSDMKVMLARAERRRDETRFSRQRSVRRSGPVRQEGVVREDAG